MKIIRIYVFSLILFTLFLPQTSGYTTAGGIEDGDEVNLHYILSYDDKVQEDNPDFTTVVEKGRIIDGFYAGLKGMKNGDQKNIVVDVGEGYPPSHNLGDKILYFDVTINEIVQSVRGNNYIAPTDAAVLFQFGKEEDTGSVFEEIFASPIFLAISMTALIGFLYLKSTGSSTTTVSNTKKSTKLTAKERLQKRMEEVDQSDFE